MTIVFNKSCDQFVDEQLYDIALYLGSAFISIGCPPAAERSYNMTQFYQYKPKAIWTSAYKKRVAPSGKILDNTPQYGKNRLCGHARAE